MQNVNPLAGPRMTPGKFPVTSSKKPPGGSVDEFRASPREELAGLMTRAKNWIAEHPEQALKGLGVGGVVAVALSLSSAGAASVGIGLAATALVGKALGTVKVDRSPGEMTITPKPLSCLLALAAGGAAGMLAPALGMAGGVVGAGLLIAGGARLMNRIVDFAMDSRTG